MKDIEFEGKNYQVREFVDFQAIELLELSKAVDGMYRAVSEKRMMDAALLSRDIVQLLVPHFDTSRLQNPAPIFKALEGALCADRRGLGPIIASRIRNAPKRLPGEVQAAG